jgi:hypothetical protein
MHLLVDEYPVMFRHQHVYIAQIVTGKSVCVASALSEILDIVKCPLERKRIAAGVDAHILGLDGIQVV